MRFRLIPLCLIGLFTMGQQCNTPAPPDVLPPALDPPTQVTLVTNQGTLVIELYDYQAPESVDLFLQYVQEGYYQDSIVHEVDGGVLIKLGRYNADLQARADKPLANESNNGLTHIRGRVALWGPADQAEGVPELLINLDDNSFFDFDLTDGTRVNYTVIGEVISGLDVAERISNLTSTTRTAEDGTDLFSIPAETVLVNRITVADDTPADDGINDPPTADAGNDRNVVTDLIVSLDARRSSDPDTGDTLSYAWEQTGGEDVTVTDANQPQASFTVPADAGTLTFQLTVTDSQGLTDTDTVTLTRVDNALVRLETTEGEIVLDMLGNPDQAPLTVLNFLQYVEDGFYNGTIIHRVMSNFVVQGGGFLPGLVRQDGLRDPIPNEFGEDRSNVRGTVAMAKLADNPDSATSQFFFNLGDNSSNLDNQNGGFTVFAEVVEGMDVVDAIAAVPTSNQQDPDGNTFENVPDEDILIQSATIE